MFILSLKAVHAGLLWTALVLIVALLLYYFIYDYRPAYYRRPRHPRPIRRYRDNRPVSIAIIIGSWILPLILANYSPDVAYNSFKLSIFDSDIVKVIVVFISMIAVIYCANYIRRRGYRINSLLLYIYSVAIFCYGIYGSYVIINAYYFFGNLIH